jgi:hypothetical protein
MEYTKVIIDDLYSLDLSGKDIIIPISYEVIDIKNLNRRSGSKTKTITIPRTLKNDKIFGLAFSINGKNQFDKYLSRKIRIEKNSQILFNGLCLLTDVTIDTISFYAFAELSKLKDLFGQLTLNDLNLDDLDHIYDKTIFDTWDGMYPIYVQPDYFYPVIDYGQFQNTNPLASSETPSINLVDMYPALYLKRAIQQICLDNGYTLKTTFFDDPQIEKILIPFVNEQFIHSDDYLTREFGLDSRNIGTYTLPDSAGVYIIPTDNILYDNLSQFSGGIYTAQGNQRINIFANCRIETPGTYPAGFYFLVSVLKYDNVLMNWISLGDKVVTNSLNPAEYISVGFRISANLNNGEQIKFIVRKFNTSAPIEINIINSLFVILPNYVTKNVRNIFPNEFVQIAPNLPPIQQIDLFKWCYQMFNWVIFVDDDKGQIEISTYDSFYQDNSQKDFSQKLSLNPNPVINYQPTDFSRKYDFKYKHDSGDFYLSRYDLQQTINQPFLFGDGRYYLTKQGDATLIGEVGFSPTIIEKSFKGHPSDFIKIPTMLNNSAPTIKNTQHEPRILINGGLVTIDTLSEGTIDHIYIEEVGAVTNLPLCYFHKQTFNEDNIDAFDLNLSFSRPDIVLYTNGNLIDKYYKNAINSLSVSAQLTAYFMLDSQDITELDFSQNWYISYFNAIFRLNKIIDYNANSLGLTKVELINVGVIDTIEDNYQIIESNN